MDGFFDIIKAIIYGIVEGITEWLPVSSTGHLILVEEFLPFKSVSEGFFDVFDVVIQLGAIIAVVILFWNKIWPFKMPDRDSQPGIMGFVKMDKIMLWLKIALACVPAVIVGLLFDDLFDALFYNAVSVAIALIVFGIGFIVIENRNRGKDARVIYLDEIDWKTALMIGGFQVLAAIFPGTSRSGATILGALLIGVSRGVATEFTFFLSIPVMFGASLLKIVKFLKTGAFFTGAELSILLVGLVVAFSVSVFAIRFLLGYIRKHDFKPFGWYRIVLGIAVLVIFGIRGRI
jgi:undecaprenyl-diphosphatase